MTNNFIQFAFITTNNSLKDISVEGDIHFCLAPFCKDISYKNFFKYNSKYVLLDNGVAENILISDLELVDLAVEMNVNELIIPDVIGDYKKTKKKRNDFLKKFYDKLDRHDIKIQSVVQGSTLDECKQCLKEIQSDSRIDVVGVPFRMNYAEFYGKTKEENQMLNRINFIKTNNFLMPVHLLGCNLLQEMVEFYYYKGVRSMDTKLISRYAMNNQNLNYNDKVKPKKKLFIDDKMTADEIRKTKLYIEQIRKKLSW